MENDTIQLPQVNVDEPPIQLESNLPAASGGNPTANASTAAKVTLSVPGWSKDFDQTQQDLSSGMESTLREQAAALMDFQKMHQQKQNITALTNSGNGLDDDTRNAILSSVSQMQNTDPVSSFEEAYANKFMSNFNDAAGRNPDSWFNESLAYIPEYTQQQLDKGTDLKAKKEFAQTLYQMATDAAENQSWPGFLADQGKELLTGGLYDEFKLRGLAGDTSAFHGLLGTNLDEQTSSTYMRPFDEFKNKNLNIVQKLIKDNPQAAVTYAAALVGQSNSDKMMNNIFSALNLSVLGDAGKLGFEALRNLKLAKQVDTAISQALKTDGFSTATQGRFMTQDEIQRGVLGTRQIMAASVGDTKEAGILNATSQISRRMQGASNPIQDSFNQVQSAFRTQAADIAANPGRSGQELANRIVESFNATSEQFADAVSNTVKVDRIPTVLAVEQNVRKLADGLKQDYPGLENSFMDVKFRHDNVTNNTFTDFILTKDGTTPFSSERVANAFINKQNLGKLATPEQQGTGWVVRMSKPLDETQPLIRQMISTKDTQTPASWLNAWGGWLGSVRTPDETLAIEHTLNRKVATFGQANLLKVAKDTAKEIRELRGWGALPGTQKRERWLDWKRVMDAYKSDRGPDGLFTNYPRNPADLEHTYQRVLGRLPDPQEVKASFSWARQEQIYNSLKNIEALRNKLRLGAERHTMFTFNQGKETPKTRFFATRSFDGVKLNSLPGGNDTMLVMGRNLGDERLTTSESYFRKSATSELREKDLKEGKLKIFQITDPGDRPFFGFGKVRDERVRYVATYQHHETEPLHWNQVPERPRDVDYEHYVVQPKVSLDNTSKFHWYEGDRKIGAFNIRALSNEVATKLDTIRQHLKNNDLEAAQAFHAGSGLPQEFSEIQNWFKWDVTPEGLPSAPRLNLNERIQTVPRGKMASEMHKELHDKYGDNFRDATTEGYGRLREGQRDWYDLFSLEKSGTKDNPLYNIVPVKNVDPITSINRALNRVINNNALDDYKMFSVEHWIQEAKQYMDAPNEKIESAPYYYFHRGVWQSGAPTEITNNLDMARIQIKQFLGIQNQTTTFLHAATQKLADSIFEHGNYKAALVPAHLLPYVRDPFSYMRSLAFHEKLGLFNIPQLLVQMQNFATTAGIAGFKYAAPATKAALLHMWASFTDDPAILAHLDKMAERTLIPGTAGFKPGQFLEARELLHNLGLGKVGNEYALRDTPFKNDLIGTEWSKFLDAGGIFFRGGEKSSRIAAFYTAYLEHRGVNPTGAISRTDARRILNRADMLGGNMSRASSSTLHQGIFSVPMQFATYTLRQAELFLGKRLTFAERSRLFFTYSALYGLPVGLSLGGIPFGDYLKQSADNNGYKVGDDWLRTAVGEGIPSLLLGLMTGHYYNIPERYASQGLDQIRDSIRSDKTIWQILAGASGEVLAQSVGGLDPFYNVMMSYIRNDNAQFHLKLEDLLEPLKSISSVSAARRMYLAANFGKWMSTNEGYISDASIPNALFMSLTGLSPAEENTMVRHGWTREEEKEWAKTAEQQAIVQFRRGYRDMKDNPQQADEYIKNGFAILELNGYPKEDYSQVIAQSVHNYESMVDQANRDYFLKHVNEFRKAAARAGYEQSLRDKYNKGQ